MIRLTAICLLLLSAEAFGQVGDTVHSHRVKGITGFGQYFGFDRDNHNYLLIKMQAIRYTMVPSDSEMACFVVNHDKDALRIKYDIWEYPDGDATKRWYRLVSMESEKGDLSWEWSAKEQRDSMLMARHHKTLREAMQLSTGGD